MITKDKLSFNLKELKKLIPRKPEKFTKVHPTTLDEGLKFYCNKRTLHFVQFITQQLCEEGWPLPLWFDPNDLKLGFWNTMYYRKTYYYKRFGKKIKDLKDFYFFFIISSIRNPSRISYDEILTEAFNKNSKYAFTKLLTNPLLQDKKNIIYSIHANYRKEDWIACISTLFPLLDFITRRILKTNNLSIDVSRICRLFQQNGFSLATSHHLMPFSTFVSSHVDGQPFISKERQEWFDKLLEFDFGLIGCGLSSFLRFANIYYQYYKEENEKEEFVLNRHAILHGSLNNFGSKENTVKLITFLYLLLELELVFEILFAEESNYKNGS